MDAWTWHCDECRGEADPPYFWTLGPFCVLCQECADLFNSPEAVELRAQGVALVAA